MIKRIAMWKFKAGTDLEKLASAIRSLEGKIDYLIDIEVGLNLNVTDSAYDLVFSATFEDEYKLREFEQDPNHKKVSAIVRAAKEQRAVVDYVF